MKENADARATRLQGIELTRRMREREAEQSRALGPGSDADKAAKGGPKGLAGFAPVPRMLARIQLSDFTSIGDVAIAGGRQGSTLYLVFVRGQERWIDLVYELNGKPATADEIARDVIGFWREIETVRKAIA